MAASGARRRVLWIAGPTIAALAVAAVVGVVYLKERVADAAPPGGVTVDAMAWRAKLFVRKLSGGVPDLSWDELWQMVRVRGGFGLGGFVAQGESLDGTIQNSLTDDEDRQAGERIYQERCLACHGTDGVGWHAPALNRTGFKRGDSDLAVYRVIRDGIPEASMPAADLQPLERWRVVGYLRSLQRLVNGDGGQRLDIRVTAERLFAAGGRADEWLTYSGSLDGRRYAPADEITPANVARLRLLWTHQFDTNDSKLEATPIVTDGIIFTTEPASNVVALDARSGREVWAFSRGVPADLPACCGQVNRGLAILDNRLFLGSLDGYLIAVDANTGQRLWQSRVAEPSEGFTLTGAPLIANRSVIVGVAGGEYGIRGFLAAFDAATGQPLWKFNTIPAPGEPGSETWGNDAWRTGGGPTWITGSYDAQLDLVYWGVGNPAPDFSGDRRPGDNLFTNSVVALRASSGKLAWHFQFTPHDEHDWDSAQTPVLVDIVINGVKRKVICWANRNGFYYVLDRATGEYLSGTAFVEQNWATGLDAKGRPILSPEARISNTGRMTKPGVAGGTNWQNPAFDERHGLIFVPATEGGSVFTKAAEPRRGDRGIFLGSLGSGLETLRPVVRALDAASGARKWEYYGLAPGAEPHSYSGLLATGGGLVFGAVGGDLFAVDASTGRELWRVSLGGVTLAPPISFTVDGHQVIAISAGRAMFAFGL